MIEDFCKEQTSYMKDVGKNIPLARGRCLSFFLESRNATALDLPRTDWREAQPLHHSVRRCEVTAAATATVPPRPPPVGASSSCPPLHPRLPTPTPEGSGSRSAAIRCLQRRTSPAWPARPGQHEEMGQIPSQSLKSPQPCIKGSQIDNSAPHSN